MRWLSRSLVLTSLLVGCSSTPLTGTGGLGLGGKKGGGGAKGGGAGGTVGTTGAGGASDSSGAAGSSGGPTGAAASSGGPSGTGGSPVDASVPDPWSYRGQHVTKVDVQRCAPYYGCDVCTLTLAGSAVPVVPNLDYTLPNPACYPPPADAGTDASSSLGGHKIPAPPPPFCGIAAPDGGDSGNSGTITEIVLQPDSDTPPFLPTIPNAYCEFLPGPTVAEPAGCLFTNFEDEFCVSDCLACP
jgi:hypothetical protein